MEFGLASSEPDATPSCVSAIHYGSRETRAGLPAALLAGLVDGQITFVRWTVFDVETHIRAQHVACGDYDRSIVKNWAQLICEKVA